MISSGFLVISDLFGCGVDSSGLLVISMLVPTGFSRVVFGKLHSCTVL